jgi:hypothetical protein
MKVMSIFKNRILTAMTGVAVLLFMSVSLSSCDVASNKDKGTFKVVMFDAPGDYDEVWVHINRVEVNNSADAESGWVVISEPDERFNLLELVNGANVVLGEADLEEGTYEQIRLILGSDNTIVIGEDSFPLMVPSGQQTGIKLNVNADIIAGITYTLLLDFDVQRSVVKQGATGSYALQPVIRAMNEALTGNITGSVEPAVEGAWVRALSGDDVVATTQTVETGEFTLVGLFDGFYTVTIDAGDDFEPFTQPDVEVKIGQVTDLGTIELTPVPAE